jgi:uracil-DNA glycosylase
MRTAITALTEELRRLKASGVTNVTISPDSLARLQTLVSKRVDASGVAATQETVLPAIEPVAAPSVRNPKKEEAPKQNFPEPPTVGLVEGDKPTRWAALRDLVLKNETCLAQLAPNKQLVFGVGDFDAKIMFVGEAPGADEETRGEPFVGPAGQLLTKMISGMGLKREETYIANIMNWRPQLPTRDGDEQIGNRPPDAEEMAYCLPFLRAQIEVVAPQVIVALGATAARGLLGLDAFRALGEVRGKWHEFEKTPLMVTYHPSYILRNKSNRSKRAIWEDLLQVMERIQMPITDKQRGYFLSG